MNKIKKIIILSTLVFGACQQDAGKQAAVKSVIAKPAAEDIVFVKIKRQLITDVVECTGKIDVPPNQRAAVYAPIGGMVTNIRVLPGDQVRKGQQLFSLVHQDIVKVQEEYLVAKNDFELQQVNFNRKQQLFAASSISDREMRMAQRDFNVARANYTSLAAQLRLIGLSPEKVTGGKIFTAIDFKAPIAGYIANVYAVSGAYVDVNSAILTIVNTRHKHVELEVYADNINRVQPGQEVRFHMAGSAVEYRAEVYLVGKEVQQDTRTVRVHAHLADEEAHNLVIGSYLYAGILVSADSVYSLPQTAIVTVDSKNYVLVKNNGQLQPVAVTLGKAFKEYVEIKDYTKLLNRQVVGDDAYYLME